MEKRFGTDKGNEPRDTSGNRGTADQQVPWREHVRFIQIWDILVLVADSTAIAGNKILSNQVRETFGEGKTPPQKTVLSGKFYCPNSYP